MAQQSTIMYVDDDPEDRMLFADAIQAVNGDCQLELVADGMHALSTLTDPNGSLPSLLVIDLNMPGMSGLELIRFLKKDNRLAAVPMVAFTTSRSSVDRQECERFGIDMHTKPLTFSDLKRSVERLLGYMSQG